MRFRLLENYSIDDEYFSAIELGDMEKAQALVDKEAKRAGYTINAYHGTDNYNSINTFKQGKKGYLGPGIYFTKDIKNAERYATKNGYDGKIYKAYLMINNPLYVHDLANPAFEILKAIYGKRGESIYRNRTSEQSFATHILTKADMNKLHSVGYDGIIWGNEKTTGRDEYLVLNPAQIKSAETITRDDKKNIIPISKRFNINSNDIRESSDI